MMVFIHAPRFAPAKRLMLESKAEAGSCRAIAWLACHRVAAVKEGSWSARSPVQVEASILKAVALRPL